MLVIRGTKKLRDRLKGPVAADDEPSTTGLGDWFATALFWRPQVALFVNTETFVPVFTELAPAATLLSRAPEAIERILQRHGVPESFLDAERSAMTEVRVAPTNNRSVLGVLNEMAFLGEHHVAAGLTDLEALSMRLAHVPLGPLRKRHRFPDLELQAFVANDEPLAEVIPIRPGADIGIRVVEPPADATPDATPAVVHTVFRLKVGLADTSPPIWRRVLVDGTRTLDHLHEVIQAAFGWWNYHLHEFEIGDGRYGVLDPDETWGESVVDERTVRLDSVAEPGTTFEYVYDFGDYWRHTILVEEVIDADADAVPACIDGRRAGPPEDCGGVWGYQELIETLADPSHPDHDNKAEWLGYPFDPERFDPSDFAENLRLQRLTVFDD